MTAPSDLARRAARRVAPAYMADRARRYELTVRQRAGVTHSARRLVADGEPVVRGGPFRGMRYPGTRLSEIDAPVAKLLGTYEHEIAWVFWRAIEQQVTAFIDLGCADGYYAVGMAHACPKTTTHAFDLATSARRLCAETATASGVEQRVHVGKRFTVEALPRHLDRALVLCDIEGAEVDVLDETVASALAHAVLVVEAHEDERPGAGARLREVFGRTHDAHTVEQEPRRQVPEALTTWTPVERSRALSEWRGPHQHWIVLDPKAGRGYG